MLDLNSGQLNISSFDVCSDVNSSVLSKIDVLDGILGSSQYSDILGNTQSSITDFFNNGTLNDITSIISSTDDIMNVGVSGLKSVVGDIINGSDVGIGDIQSILDCVNSFTGYNINSGLPDIPGYTISDLGLSSVPSVNNLRIFIGDISNKYFGYVDDLFNTNLDPYQKLLFDQLYQLTNLLPNGLVDEIFHILQCLENCVNEPPDNPYPYVPPGDGVTYEVFCIDEQEYFYIRVMMEDDITCPNDPTHRITYQPAPSLPDSISIEDKLLNSGLSINGVPDWTSSVWNGLNMTETVGNSFNSLIDVKKTLSNSLTEIANVNVLGIIPEIPIVERLPNPLKELDFNQKIDMLFADF